MTKAKVTTLRSRFPEFKKALQKIHKRESEEFSKDMEREGRRLLNLTLEKRRPQTGFAKARVRIDKNIKVNEEGCIVKMHFLVADGSSRTPHRIWHIINRGRKDFIAQKTTKFKSTISPRTGPKRGVGSRQLEVRSPSGKGNWVTISKGKKYGKIRGREFYKETIRRMRAKTLKRSRYKFIEVTKFEANNG